MGKVVVPVKVTNWRDIEQVAYGERSEAPRTLGFEALVDTGATGFYLRKDVIAQLGLRQIGEKTSRTMSNRRESRKLFTPVELEIQNRRCRVEVIELPDELPNIVGQVPLEMMDWVIDMQGRKLIGNPEHNGEELYEEFSDQP